MANLSSVIDAINKQVDGLALARLTDYHPDKIQHSGSTLKCFCPVHQESAFRSLILNGKTHTFKCMMRRCKCFEGGSFVQFWSIFTGKELIDAALELAERLNLEIDKQAVQQLAASFVEDGRKALAGSRLVDARGAIEEALALDPHNTDARLQSALIWSAAGQPDRALADHLSVLERWMEEQKFNLASELIARLLQEFPDNADLLDFQVRISRQEGETRELITALVRRADALEKKGQAREALQVLSEARDQSPDDPALQQRIAGLCKKLGLDEEYRDALGRLTGLYEGLGESQRLLETLQLRIDLDPDNLDLSRRRARVLREEGMNDQAREVELEVIARLGDTGRSEDAIALIVELLIADPQENILLEQKARLLIQIGRPEQAVEDYRRLAAQARHAGDAQRVGDYFALARDIAPRDCELCRDQAEWKLEQGDLDGGLNELVALATILLEAERVADGKAVLERVAELAPADVDKRIRVGRCLERHGLEEDAYQSYLGLARQLIGQKQFDSANAIAEEARRLRPNDTETLELRVDSHLALKQKDEAMEACREVARAHLAADNIERAEQVLLRAIRIDRAEIAPKTDLAQLYEKTGRPAQAVQLWIEMALLHRAQNQALEANTAIGHALRLDPDNREALVFRAEALEAGGEKVKACDIWRNLGRLCMDESPDDPQALQWLNRALDLSPRDVELLDDVTCLTIAQQDTDAALPICERWLDALQNHPDAAAVIAAYRLAVRNYPQRTEWRQRLASLLMEAGESDEAADQLEELLRDLAAQTAQQAQRHAILETLTTLRPDSPELQVELARSAIRIGRPHDAIRLFREQAQEHMRHDRHKAALALYEEALQSLPDHMEMLALAAELNDKLGQTDRALERYNRLAELNRRMTDRSANIPVLEKILAHRPSESILHAELAELYETDGDIDKAVEHAYAVANNLAEKPDEIDGLVDACLKIRSMAPDFTPARELLVKGLLARKDLPKAKEELDALADQALAAGKVEQAEDYFKRIRDIDPDDIGSGERLGKLYEAAGKVDEAAEAFTRVLEIYEKLSESARAISVLQKLKNLHPEDLEIRLRLARAFLAARAEQRETGEEWLDLIGRAVQKGPKKLATAIIEEARPAFATDWSWRSQLARVLSNPKNPKAALEQWLCLANDALAASANEIAREAASEGLLLDPDHVGMIEIRIETNRRLTNYDAAAVDLRLLAEKQFASGNFQQSIACLQQALELTPRSAELMEMLAESELAAGHVNEGRQVLRNLAELHRQDEKLELAVDCATRIVGLERSEETQDYLATLLAEADRLDEAIAIWRQLADACASGGNLEAALLRYTRILEFLPGNIEILRRMADLSYENGGLQAATAQYDRLFAALGALEDPAALEAEYLRVLEIEPGHMQLKELLAEHLAGQSRTDEAREHLLEVIAVYRDDRDQSDEALRVLRRLQALDPENIEVREQEAVMLENLDMTAEAAAAWRKLAAVHRRNEDFSQAAGCLVHCAQLEEDNPQAQIEVAEVYAILDDTRQATDYYLRAIDIYDRQENPEPCVEILQRAIAINPDRHDLIDALARMFERLDQPEKAAVQWLELGAAYENKKMNAEAAAVYTHLRALLPEDLECRNRLAELYERTNDRQNALNELRGLVALAHAHDDPQGEAVYLERLLELDPNDENALLELAAVMARLERSDRRFDLLTRLERLYCAAGRHDEALKILDDLKALRPEDPELMNLSIELLIKTDRVDTAAQQGIELIQTYFDRQDDQRALEMLGHITEIDPDNIERRISLARLVHVNGRHQAAFQEFFLLASRLFGEERWEDCLQVCGAGLELYRDDVRLRDLMGRSLIKLDRRAEAIEVQLHLAAIYDERGEESKAQRVYESILEEQPDHQATLEAMVDWALRHERNNVAVEHLVQLAEGHYVAGELQRAIDAMERIQKIDASRLDLKSRLAEIYLETGDKSAACATWLAAAQGLMETADAPGAIAVFEKALQLRPDDLEILESLGEAYAACDRADDHLNCANRLAEILLKSGNTTRVRDLLDTLTQRHPDEPQPWERLAELERAAGNDERAVDAYRCLARIHRDARRLNEARQALDKALELAPGQFDLLNAQGDLLLSLGRRADGIGLLACAADALLADSQHKEARDLCHRILKLDPHNLSVRRQLAGALEQLGSLPEALEEYRQAARGLADAKDHAAAIEILQHLLTLEPSRLEERELFAKLLRREGRSEESNNQYLLLLDMLGESEDPRRAIKYCRQILEENADHPQAHMHLCAIYERASKWRQAFKECEWLVDYYESKGALEEAEHHIRKALGWLPEELGMRTRLVELLIQRQRLDEAAVELAEVAGQAEARADLKMSRWAMLKACEIQPNDLGPHRRLADFLERQGELAEARAARMKLIRLLLSAGRMDEARDIAERVVDAVIEDDALRIEIAAMFEEAGLPEVAAFHFHHLARRALTAEQFEEAIRYCRRTIDLKPRHVGARETLIGVLLAQRNNKQALKEYEELYALYDEASEWEGALKTLQATIELVPSEPDPRHKLITLYRKMHREEPMIDQMRRLVEIHVNAGNYERAVDCLRDLMTIRPEDTRARVRYIDIYTQIGDESELMEDFLQLARILGRKGSVVEAMRTYEKLLQVHPAQPVCREEFVQFLFEQGQVHRGIEESRALAELFVRADNAREAGRVLERALNYAPEELEMRQQLAGIYMLTNRRGLALDAYRSLARQFEQSGDQKHLIEVIEQIVQIDQLNVEYRQRLAELYHRNDMVEQATEQSMALAEQYLERELFDLAEHEIRRVLEIRPNDVALWRRLIQAHTKIGQLQDLLPELTVFAELLTRNGKLKDASGVYRQVMDCDPDNMTALEKYIEIYVQIGHEQDLVDDYLRLAGLKTKAGDAAEANRIYQHLMQIDPDNRIVRDRLNETNQMLARGGTNKKAKQQAVIPDPLAAMDESMKPPADPSATRKLIRTYENVLKLNDRNPVARVKLAELLEHSGDLDGADHHWRRAIEQFLDKGELERCIDTGNRYLEQHPDDSTVRDLLNRAKVKRDSMNAIDGALSDQA